MSQFETHFDSRHFKTITVWKMGNAVEKHSLSLDAQCFPNMTKAAGKRLLGYSPLDYLTIRRSVRSRLGQ